MSRNLPFTCTGISSVFSTSNAGSNFGHGAYANAEMPDVSLSPSACPDPIGDGERAGVRGTLDFGPWTLDIFSPNSSARCGANGCNKIKNSRKTEIGLASQVIASFTKTINAEIAVLKRIP